MNPPDHNCSHPITAHTGTADTWPWLICAHPGCGCTIVASQ